MVEAIALIVDGKALQLVLVIVEAYDCGTRVASDCTHRASNAAADVLPLSNETIY